MTELCKVANLSRRTFYVYYQSPDEIFGEYELEISKIIDQAFAKSDNDTIALINVIDEVLLHNFDKFQLIYMTDRHYPLLRKISDLLMRSLENCLPIKPTSENVLILRNLASGVVGTYMYWFRHCEGISYAELRSANAKVIESSLNLLTYLDEPKKNSENCS